jgi:L-lactate utilization protein LutB
MVTFRERIRQSIEDETLQTALDNNSERRLRGLALAYESIPDWRARRQRAHTIRADVIEHNLSKKTKRMASLFIVRRMQGKRYRLFYQS